MSGAADHFSQEEMRRATLGEEPLPGGDGMVLWASSEPTEFLIDGKIARVSPGDVALAHNLFMEHRIPPIIGANRWFCRIPVLAPAWLEKDVDNVSGIL